MNSLQKKNQQDSASHRETFLESFEKTLKSMDDISEVELLMKKLQFLGLNYDPFNSDISQECGQIMDNLGIREHLLNPYQATNILLRLLDKTEEQINKLKQ
ncbi:MAG: hypothetical protein AB7I27_16185 [Bacteriovoracaceae bacterium]